MSDESKTFLELCEEAGTCRNEHDVDVVKALWSADERQRFTEGIEASAGLIGDDYAALAKAGLVIPRDQP